MTLPRLLRITLLVIVVFTIVAAAWLWQDRPITWSGDKQVSFGTGDSRLVDVKASASSSVVHLVWEDDREGSTEVFYKRSTDNGITWEADVKLTQLSSNTTEPAPRIAAFGGHVLVFFSNQTVTGQHLFYSVSDDEGERFSDPIPLTADDGDQTNVAVAMVGNVVHVVWQSYFRGSSEVVYLRSLDAGSTWGEEISLTKTKTLDRHPAIFATAQQVLTVWSRNEEGREAIFFRASTDSGTTWQPEVQLSEFSPLVFPLFPSVGSNGTHVHVVWNGAEVEYVRSADAGVNWDTPVPLTNSTRQYLAPEISVVASLLQVVSPVILTQGRNVTAYMYNLISFDGGNHWQQPLLLSSHKSALSLAPAISSRPDATFVAWQDNRNGRFAIFVASKPDFTLLRSFGTQLAAQAGIVIAAAVIVLLLSQTKSFERVLSTKPETSNETQKEARMIECTKKVGLTSAN